jgi:hypothetical protein
MTTKYTKLPLNKAKGHKIYKMVTKYFKIFHSKAYEIVCTKTLGLV